MPENNQKITIEELAVITKEGFDAVDKQIEELRTVVSRLPDKAYLDDKLADLEGSVIVRQRKGDQKINLLVDFLRRKNILGEGEVKMLDEIQVFPKIQIAK